MRTLVTGATGLIGNRLARLLLERGHSVRALVREVDRARTMLPPEVELVFGDITLPETLPPAMQGCTWLFHTAGMPEQWQADLGIFDRVNRQGTANVMEAALAAGVSRVVYTSTMDVFEAANFGDLDESRYATAPRKTHYERSKVAAEREVEKVQARGLDVVYVNPAAVYGPSPVHVSLNYFFLRLLKGGVPLLPPGGMSVAFVDGVAGAHLEAMERGRSGERYLVADELQSMKGMATALKKLTGTTRVPLVAPAWMLWLTAWVLAPLARAFRFKPLVTAGELEFILWSPRVLSAKAQRELGFKAMPFEEGLRRTVESFREQGLAPRR